jgi:hypothetical protein
LNPVLSEACATHDRQKENEHLPQLQDILAGENKWKETGLMTN